MANAPTSTKRRQLGRKAEDIRLVWKEQAPDAVYAGKSLADLNTAMEAVKTANEEIDRLAKALSAAQKVRDEKTAALRKLLNFVVRGVQGHAEYGEDSPVYRAMGYVPTSERKSGLKRRSKKDTGDPAPDGKAAV